MTNVNSPTPPTVSTVEKDAASTATAAVSSFDAWLPIGNHRWWVAVTVSFVLGVLFHLLVV